MEHKIAGYAVIFEQYDSKDGRVEYSRCIGVFKTRREALGAAYEHAEIMIHENSDDISCRMMANFRLGIPEEMEGQTGEFIRFMLTDENGSSEEEFAECIYEVWEEDL